MDTFGVGITDVINANGKWVWQETTTRSYETEQEAVEARNRCLDLCRRQQVLVRETGKPWWMR